MQEYLVEVALQQQQQPEPQQQQTSQQAVTATGAAVLPAQNGAQHNEVAEEVHTYPKICLHIIYYLAYLNQMRIHTWLVPAL